MGGCEQVVGLKRDFDQRLQTCVGGEVKDGLRLCLAQHQGGGMRFLQTLETMPEQEPLAEVQCGLDIGKPHRF